MPDRPILPPRLKRGDVIGLCCPAGPVRDPQRLQDGIRLIETMGFAIKLRGPVEPRDGYLADDDAGRASLNRLFAKAKQDLAKAEELMTRLSRLTYC